MKAKHIRTGFDTSRMHQKLPAFFISWTYKGNKFYKFEKLRMGIETVKRGIIVNPEIYSK